MGKLTSCPKCHVSFIGPQIPDGLFSAGVYKSFEECLRLAKEFYRWTPETGEYFSQNIVFHHHRDNALDYWECTQCGYTMNKEDY